MQTDLSENTGKLAKTIDLRYIWEAQSTRTTFPFRVEQVNK